MSKYKIEYAPSYTSNGCDCCEPTEWENWDLRHEDGSLLRTYSSLEDALLFILSKNDISVEVDYDISEE